MPNFTQDQITQALKTVQEPELHKDIVTLGMVKSIEIQGKNVIIEITLTTPACPLKDKITEDIRLALRGSLPEVGDIQVKWDAQVMGSRPIGQTQTRLPTVKNVIAVGSGKGGVGKSTVAVNLAVALKQEGASVGILDADIYGPSLPVMFGIPEGKKPSLTANNRILPLSQFGMPLMSMGFLMGSADAVVWRGPMLAKMLQQFLEQVEWGNLDYLIVDLPPGTGDVQLSLSQLIPLSGAVVVTTPQDVALADVKRAIKMFQMTRIPILGIVENMSYFECPHCHQKEEIFGGSADKGRYQKLGASFLGELPFEKKTRIAGDEGIPISEREPKSTQAERFRALARQVAASQSVVNYNKDLELPSLH